MQGNVESLILPFLKGVIILHRTLLMILLVAIGTAIFGEVKIQPFASQFRVALGSTFFILCIVYWYGLPLRLTGLVTGLITVGWRVSLDLNIGVGFIDSIMNHFPTLFYYLVFVYFLYNLKWWEKRSFPIHVGAIILLADISSNLIELLVRSGFQISYISPGRIWFIFIVAVLRGLVVVLLSKLILQERFREAQAVEGKQFVKTMLVKSNLHMETFYLRKSMDHVETVMARSYNLYQELKAEDTGNLAVTALNITTEIHEIKKDLKRMEEGIKQLVAQAPTTEIIQLQEVLDLVAQANLAYAVSEGKTIEVQIEADIKDNYGIKYIYPLVSILNNLVQNSVEAIRDIGEIKVKAHVHKGIVLIDVMDNGPGIADDERELVFAPGFTSKFNPEGRPSTGVGLTYVRDMVEHLGGKIQLKKSKGQGTWFSLQLPLKTEVSKDGM